MCLSLLTFSINQPLSWGCIGRGQLLFDLGNVLGMKVVKQALTYQVVLEAAGAERGERRQRNEEQGKQREQRSFVEGNVDN